jgi:hypothetical protein
MRNVAVDPVRRCAVIAARLKIGDRVLLRGEPARVLSATHDSHEYRTVLVTVRYADGTIRNLRMPDNAPVRLCGAP